ncbi:acyl carrier protein [Streptomyces sp. NPDC127117]|uniref:acyl carrier protein n=1 Tax=Streptomyces sp. NPDC127117 TaxID=3345368 RepID=UPI003625E5A9
MQPVAQLAQIWLTVFGTEPGPDDNLADIGMESVKLVELILHVQKELGVDLPLETFLGPTTLREVAAEIAAQEGTRT